MAIRGKFDPAKKANATSHRLTLASMFCCVNTHVTTNKVMSVFTRFSASNFIATNNIDQWTTKHLLPVIFQLSSKTKINRKSVTSSAMFDIFVLWRSFNLFRCVFRRQWTLPGRKRQHHVSAQSCDSYDVSALWSHAHRTLYRWSRRVEQPGLFQWRAGGSGSTVFRATALYVSRRWLRSSDAVSTRFCVIFGDILQLSARYLTF